MAYQPLISYLNVPTFLSTLLQTLAIHYPSYPNVKYHLVRSVAWITLKQNINLDLKKKKNYSTCK
jgi:hypothetical protein